MDVVTTNIKHGKEYNAPSFRKFPRKTKEYIIIWGCYKYIWENKICFQSNDQKKSKSKLNIESWINQ